MTTLALNEFFHRIFFRSPSSTDMVTKTDGLFMMLWWFGVFWFVLLMGLMVYWVIKYRRRPGVAAPISPSHNTPLEIFWTVVPSSSLLVFFLLGFWGYMSKMTPEKEAIELRLSGWKWGWKISYPAGEESTWLRALSPGGVEFPVFVVPEDTPVKLRMSSQDVIHAFWIPEMRTKMDVYPNRYTGYAFRTPKLSVDDRWEGPGGEVPGRAMWIFCAEYCGTMHSEMAATLLIVPKTEYTRILGDFGGGSLTPEQLGEVLWKQKCAACHSVNGSKNVGPSWLAGERDGMAYGYGYPVKFVDGGEVVRDANYFRESVLKPMDHIVQGYAGAMPSFDGQLSETQLDALLAYYRALSDRAPETAPAPDAAPEGDAPADGAPAADSPPDAPAAQGE